MNTNTQHNSSFKLTLIGYILISAASNGFYQNRFWNDETILWLWIALALTGSIMLLMKDITHFKKYQKLLMPKDLLFIIPVITIPLLPIRHDFSLMITLIYEIVYILIYIFSYYKKVQ